MSALVFQARNKGGNRMIIVAGDVASAEQICVNCRFVRSVKNLTLVDVTSEVIGGNFFSVTETDVYKRNLDNMICGVASCSYSGPSGSAVGIYDPAVGVVWYR